MLVTQPPAKEMISLRAADCIDIMLSPGVAADDVVIGSPLPTRVRIRNRGACCSCLKYCRWSRLGLNSEAAGWSRSYGAHDLSVWYISFFSFSCFSFCYWLITIFSFCYWLITIFFPFTI